MMHSAVVAEKLQCKEKLEYSLQK